MKRTRTQAFGASRGGVRKIRKGNANRVYKSSVPPGRLGKRYVARTPGGQIVADNHYFDGQSLQATQAITAISTIWTNGTHLETYKGAAGTTAIGSLFCPVEGNDITDRYGRKAFLKKIRIVGTLRVPKQSAQNAADNGMKIRIIVVRDGQTNGAALTPANVISSGFEVPAIDMFQNTANFGRYKIYKDKIITFDNPSMANDTGATAGIVQSGLEKHFKLNVNVNDWVTFNATNGGTIADIVDNSYHLLIACDNGDYATTVAFKFRCVFDP